jgi:hypothetical protein
MPTHPDWLGALAAMDRASNNAAVQRPKTKELRYGFA